MNYTDYKGLSKFLKFFISRPNHLARYLIENDALNKDFLKKISSIDKADVDESNLISVYFLDINQMNNFFNRLIENGGGQLDSNENLIEELEKELQNCLFEERYEDAIRIRDYLKNIKNKKVTKP
jgi:protein-arginine kinase activator protein McsA